MRTLWDHQRKGVEGVQSAIAAGERRICLTGPTGSGKSVEMYELIRWASDMGWPSALYTDRRMLFDQIAGQLDDEGIQHGKRASGHNPSLLCDVQLAMTQTELSKVYRAEKRSLHRAKLVLIDECHKQTGEVMSRIIKEHVEDHGAAVVGVTATPLDLEGLYTHLVVAGVNSELRAAGVLVPAHTYGPDEPDTRHIKRQKTGEFTQGDVVKAIMTPTIFGRVLEWWKKLNPDALPTILFAPGVAESLWFAEQFEKAGIRAAHIDGNDVYLDGQIMKSDSEARAQVMLESERGYLSVICNRFVLREGIDAKWIVHGIFATAFGSVTSYIQSGGRLLRAFPGKTHAIIQDHGGNWWRHGSLNADRHWELGGTAKEYTDQRFERLRKKEEREPIVCPACGACRLTGDTCWKCQHKADRKRRMVAQVDGSLRPYYGDIFKPRKVRIESDTEKHWKQCYFRAKNGKRPMTFEQAAGLFHKEHGYFPPRDLPFMPKSDVDWKRKVNSVKFSELHMPEKKEQAPDPQRRFA